MGDRLEQMAVAHIAGLPVEELVWFTPVIGLAIGLLAATPAAARGACARRFGDRRPPLEEN
jgi:hypothetical protein